MAARKTRGTKSNRWSEEHRERIKTSMLLNRLQDHVLGKIELTPSQVNAIAILLRKTVPDLSAVDMNVRGKLEAQIVDLVRSLGESASREESTEETMH